MSLGLASSSKCISGWSIYQVSVSKTALLMQGFGLQINKKNRMHTELICHASAHMSFNFINKKNCRPVYQRIKNI